MNIWDAILPGLMAGVILGIMIILWSKKIKFLSVVFLLAASTSPSVGFAQTIEGNTDNEVFASIICPVMGTLATVIMELRQKGTDMSVVIKKLTEGAKMPEKRIIMDIIISAYELPQMRVAENRSEAVVDFSNNYQVSCYTTDWAAAGY